MDKNQGESEVSSQTAEQTKVSEEEEACDAVTHCSLKDVVLVYAYSSLRRERELWSHCHVSRLLLHMHAHLFLFLFLTTTHLYH